MRPQSRSLTVGLLVKKRKRKDYTNKVTPLCVNLGRSLHLVQAPGEPPPSNEEELRVG